jgi:hypothetical protein
MQGQNINVAGAGLPGIGEEGLMWTRERNMSICPYIIPS